MIKTRPAVLRTRPDRILALHPYEVPEILRRSRSTTAAPLTSNGCAIRRRRERIRYAFATILMRPPTALFPCFVVGLAIACWGCANRPAAARPRRRRRGLRGRGRHGGARRRDGHGRPGRRRRQRRQRRIGLAPRPGHGWPVVPRHGRRRRLPSSPRGRSTPCSACNGVMFNFESGTHGAVINAGSTAFTSITKVGTSTYCGSGALAITGLFQRNQRHHHQGRGAHQPAGAPLDLTGKTITVHVAADPGCSTDLNLSVVLNTQPARSISRPRSRSARSRTPGRPAQRWSPQSPAPPPRSPSACRRSRPPATRDDLRRRDRRPVRLGGLGGLG